jgi:predicted dehydrogenase
MTFDPLRVAVLGFGFMGRTHAACYASNPNAHLVAVCSPSIQDAATTSVAGNLDTQTELDLTGVELVSDINTLIERDDLDAVDICLPTPMHEAVAVRFLQVGKHVLCEKPMARTLSGCDAMIEAQRKSGKTLMIGHVLRFWPHYLKAHELLAHGELGQITSARFERQSPVPRWSRWMLDPAQSGGAPLDLHLHDADVALWWFGEPSGVQASGVVQSELPLRIEANWKYQQGPHVSFLGSWDWNDAPYRMAFELVGERATLRFDSGRDNELHFFEHGKSRVLPVDEGDAYAAQLAAFIECAQTQTGPKHGAPATSRRAVEIVLQELRQMGVSLDKQP